MTTVDAPGGGSSPEPARPKRGQYAKSAQRRVEIIAAATSVFATKGYEGGSLRDISRLLGMSLTAVVHHFPTKYDLLEAVLTYANDTNQVSGPEDCRLRGVEQAVLDQVEVNLARPQLLRMLAIVVNEASSPEHPAHRWTVQRYESSVQGWIVAIAHDQEVGRIGRSRDPETLARALVALWDGTQLQWLLDPRVQMVHVMRVSLAALFSHDPTDPQPS